MFKFGYRVEEREMSWAEWLASIFTIECRTEGRLTTLSFGLFWPLALIGSIGLAVLS